MPRLPRYAAPGQPQHVIQRGNNRSSLFADDADYRFFRDSVASAIARHRCRIHAYVFMTNHVHFIMTPETEGGVGSVMQSAGIRYVRYFNNRYGRTGTLWEGRYRATVIDTDRYLLTCSRYIELNPVRAQLASHPGEYAWSSYEANALGRPDRLVTSHELYDALGADPTSRQRSYRALFRDAIDETDLRSIRRATNTGWALGNARFREGLAGVSKRRAAPLPRGGRRDAPGQRL